MLSSARQAPIYSFAIIGAKMNVQLIYAGFVNPGPSNAVMVTYTPIANFVWSLSLDSL